MSTPSLQSGMRKTTARKKTLGDRGEEDDRGGGGGDERERVSGRGCGALQTVKVPTRKRERSATGAWREIPTGTGSLSFERRVSAFRRESERVLSPVPSRFRLVSASSLASFIRFLCPFPTPFHARLCPLKIGINSPATPSWLVSLPIGVRSTAVRQLADRCSRVRLR